MLQLSSPSHKLRRERVTVVVLPDDFPLCVPRSCAGLEVKELLLLLGVLPPLTTSPFWRFVEACPCWKTLSVAKLG